MRPAAASHGRKPEFCYAFKQLRFMYSFRAPIRWGGVGGTRFTRFNHAAFRFSFRFGRIILFFILRDVIKS
jgi:hypothetical protein